MELVLKTSVKQWPTLLASQKILSVIVVVYKFNCEKNPFGFGIQNSDLKIISMKIGLIILFIWKNNADVLHKDVNKITRLFKEKTRVTTKIIVVIFGNT